MSLRTLPLLVINLGGEMLYILDQRLQEQGVSDDKTQKGTWSEDDRKRVLSDIVSTMFCVESTAELLKPQAPYSHRALRTLLTRLAHASIMRLSAASMDKLYDLMTMAFKYQLWLCARPRDLLLITFNHIDAVRGLISHSPALTNRVTDTQRQLIEMYTPLSDGEFQLIRQTLLGLFQDMHIKVSVFQREKLQNPNGHFVLPTSGPVANGSQVPGLIRAFNRRGQEVKRREFPSRGSYTSPLREGSFDTFGDRVTVLGTNMYAVTSHNVTHTSAPSRSSSRSAEVDAAPNPLAKEELKLLAQLMGSVEFQNQPGRDAGFRVNLFFTGQEEEEHGAAGVMDEGFSVINIQPTKDHLATSALAQIVEEFTEQSELTAEPSNKGNELLAMMDDL